MHWTVDKRQADSCKSARGNRRQELEDITSSSSSSR